MHRDTLYIVFLLELTLLNIMAERKPWTDPQDQQLMKFISSQRFVSGQKLRWRDISRQLQSIGSKRSGKQCRQRWCNHLRSGIENDKYWSKDQQKILFAQQQQHGNRWCLIAKALPGRSENNIKNYFYSTLRRAIRKVNTYIASNKKEQRYRNVKQFKPQNLSKILTVAEKKYQQKLNLKNNGVITDAIKIKKLLIQIIVDHKVEECHQRCELLDETVQEILQFNRNCKRRKGKKKDDKNVEKQVSSQSEYMGKQIKNQDGQSYSQKKQTINKVQINYKCEVENKIESTIRNKSVDLNNDEQSLLNIFEKDIFHFYDKYGEFHSQKSIFYDNAKKSIENKYIKNSSSSGNNVSSLLDRSSSGRFRSGSFGSHQFSKQEKEGLNILDSIIPIFEVKRTQEQNGTIFLKQAGTTNNSIFLDQSRGFNIFDDESFIVGGLFANQLQISRRHTSYGQKPYDNNQIQ